MSDGFKNAFGKQPSGDGDGGENEVGRALLVGIVGGLLSAAGYFVYRRLPDEHKERLHEQVRGAVAQKVNELRQNFNI